MENTRLLQKAECVIEGSFWNRYIEIVRDKVIPYQWDILNDRIEGTEPSHAIENFKIAAKEKEGNFYGEIFQDSDLYKWLEAVGNILMLQRDEELEKYADEVIELIGRAQEPDGYLNTYFTIEEPDKKWTNLLECHELYCAGHFIEGAISYYLATKKEKVLNIATKLADHLTDVFGAEKGKIHGYPGHQEIEIALIKLFDVTGSFKYLELSQYFIDTRGTNHFFEEEFEKRDYICHWTKEKVEEPNRRYNQFPYNYYNQFHLPVREQEEAVGHAVRGVYMYTAMADLASRNQDESLWNSCKKIWNNIVEKQLYITGGIGATHSGEAFTVSYDLPNDTNYSETCASIGLMFFAQKMLKTEVDSTYGDVIEQALYNTFLGGMNYEGNRFFYVNPLEVVPQTCRGNPERNHVKPVRQKWFACACCPPNIARTIPNLWQYIYTVKENTVYLHLYMGSRSNIQLVDGILRVKQETNYPWDGRVSFDISANTKAPLTLALRVPHWCKGYTLVMDDKEIKLPKEKGYLYLKRDWSKGAKLIFDMEMKAELIQSSHKIHYNAGRAAIVRGPLVYCLEEIDHGAYLNQITLDSKSELKEIPSELWGGSVWVQASGYRKIQDTKNHQLYYSYEDKEEQINLTAIPYFLWNNREPGEMQVWIRTK